MTAIVLAADEKYLPYACCNLTQIAKFGRRSEGVIMVVPPTLQASDLAGLTAVANANGIGFETVPVNELAPLADRGLLPNSGYISNFTFAKLLLAEILPNHDDVLYLDIDTVVRAPLDPLLSWELRHPVGAVEELTQNSRRMFGTSRKPYFNAGVLRLSLERMRQEGVWRQSQKIMEEQPMLRFQDQDVLNLLFRERFEILPQTYNVFDSISSRNQHLWVYRDPAIVHFAGPIKPWHQSADSEFAREWRQIFEEALRSGGPTLNTKRDAKAAGLTASEANISALARKLLPAPAKRKARTVLQRALTGASSRLEEAKVALELGPQWRANLEVSLPTPERSRHGADLKRLADSEEQGLDLLISLPNCGAGALSTMLRDSEAAAKAGRRLCTVFPKDLGPMEFEELLHARRPRLLLLRRQMVFSYAEPSRAHDGISESAAAEYVLSCDSWFDRAARVAEQIELATLSLTFDGLFHSGSEIPLLQEFYPDAVLPLHPRSGTLHPDVAIGRQRADADVLELLRSVSALSTSTRFNLLRLPGQTIPSRDRRGKPKAQR